MKFITDANLGSLTKWLRILGYDTVLYGGNADRNFLRKAQKEDRIVLTKKRDLAHRQFSGHLLVVQTDLATNQIREVINELSLKPEPGRMFSICLKCNEPLKKIERYAVEGLVPAYIFEHHMNFRICPFCKSIYWPGTHKDRALDFLRIIGL